MGLEDIRTTEKEYSVRGEITRKPKEAAGRGVKKERFTKLE